MDKKMKVVHISFHNIMQHLELQLDILFKDVYKTCFYCNKQWMVVMTSLNGFKIVQ